MTVFNQLWAARNMFSARRRLPQDLVVVDFDAAGTRCVRARLGGGSVVVTAADILPAVDIGNADQVKAFALPKNMAARHVAVCITGHDAIVKLLSLPGAIDDKLEDKIRENMGVEGGNYRFGYRIISQSHSETRMLAVAVPESQVQESLAVFPVGVPAPVSVELGGIALLSAFMHAPGKDIREEAVALIELGSRISYFAFFNKLELILIRKFDFGSLDLLERIEKNMGVDRQTAQNVVLERSFDISQLVRDLADPFVKQLIISKHFVERRENCQVARIYMADDPLAARDWLGGIKTALGLDVCPWQPFDGVKLMPDVLSGKSENLRSHFAAALGAAWGLSEAGLAGPGG